MILVVGINLAIDRFVNVESLSLGGVHLSARPTDRPGGKGANVVRTLTTLREPALGLGFTGGRTGRWVRHALAREGLAFETVDIVAESRTCLIIDDRERREQTVVNEPGPSIREDELAALVTRFEALVRDARLAVVTGSVPPGVPADTYARLIRIAADAGVRCLLDAKGPSLTVALEARPLIVKVNRVEAAGRSVQDLVGLGADNAIITDGGGDIDALVALERFTVTPPEIETRNTVGCGDAMLAGLAAGVLRGVTGGNLVQFGVECATAHAL